MDRNPVCGTIINPEGFFILLNGISDENAVSLKYLSREICFCEEICKKEYIEVKDKDYWLKNH